MSSILFFLVVWGDNNGQGRVAVNVKIKIYWKLRRYSTYASTQKLVVVLSFFSNDLKILNRVSYNLLLMMII